MRLSETAKQYEECMENAGPCLVQDCPLYRDITLKVGAPGDQFGTIIWRVEACTLMGRLQDWLKNKKPGKPYELEEGDT